MFGAGIIFGSFCSTIVVGNIYNNREVTVTFALLRDRLILAPRSAGMTVNCFSILSYKIVFGNIYNNRKVAVTFALLRDRLILVARSAGTTVNAFFSILSLKNRVRQHIQES